MLAGIVSGVLLIVTLVAVYREAVHEREKNEAFFKGYDEGFENGREISQDDYDDAFESGREDYEHGGSR